MSLFEDMPVVVPASQVEEVDVADLVDEDELLSSSSFAEIDPATQVAFIYTTECVNLDVASLGTKSIAEVIKEQEYNLGLPSDLTNLSVIANNRKLSSAELQEQPTVGTLYMLAIQHESKQQS